jgi:hypothetical protein
MSEYPAGVTGAEIDGAVSLLDENSAEDVIEQVLADSKEKLKLSFFYDKYLDQANDEHGVIGNMWDLLNVTQRHEIADSFIKSVYAEEFVKFIEENA